MKKIVLTAVLIGQVSLGFGATLEGESGSLPPGQNVQASPRPTELSMRLAWLMENDLTALRDFESFREGLQIAFLEQMAVQIAAVNSVSGKTLFQRFFDVAQDRVQDNLLGRSTRGCISRHALSSMPFHERIRYLAVVRKGLEQQGRELQDLRQKMDPNHPVVEAFLAAKGISFIEASKHQLNDLWGAVQNFDFLALNKSLIPPTERDHAAFKASLAAAGVLFENATRLQVTAAKEAAILALNKDSLDASTRKHSAFQASLRAARNGDVVTLDEATRPEFSAAIAAVQLAGYKDKLGRQKNGHPAFNATLEAAKVSLEEATLSELTAAYKATIPDAEKQHPAFTAELGSPGFEAARMAEIIRASTRYILATVPDPNNYTDEQHMMMHDYAYEEYHRVRKEAASRDAMNTGDSNGGQTS